MKCYYSSICQNNKDVRTTVLKVNMGRVFPDDGEVVNFTRLICAFSGNMVLLGQLAASSWSVIADLRRFCANYGKSQFTHSKMIVKCQIFAKRRENPLGKCKIRGFSASLQLRTFTSYLYEYRHSLLDQNLSILIVPDLKKEQK